MEGALSARQVTSEAVYLSAAGKHQPLIEELGKHLKTAGLSPCHEKHLPIGAKRDVLVEAKISGACCFVPLVDADYLSSARGRQELDWALRAGRRIAPVLVGAVDVTGTALANLTVLPRSGVPIKKAQDQNLVDVAREIAAIVQEEQAHRSTPSAPAVHATVQTSAVQPSRAQGRSRSVVMSLGLLAGLSIGTVALERQPLVLYVAKKMGHRGHKLPSLFEWVCQEGPGSSQACGAFSSFLLTGDAGVTKDLPRAARLADKACTSREKSQIGCHVYALLYKAGQTTEGRPDNKRYVELLNAACSREVPRACVDLVAAHMQQRELDAAKKLASSLCGWGDNLGCLYLGQLQIQEGDEKGAMTSFQTSCYAGDGNGEGCQQLAPLLSDAEKETTYRRACDLGAGLSCYNAAQRITNLTEKAALYSRGCERKSGIACRSLGHAQDYGLGVQQDRDLAYNSYSKGCQYGDRDSCLNQGLCLELGIGVGQNEPLSRAFVESACQQGSEAACGKLWRMSR